MKVGDMCRFAAGKRPTNTWAIGMIVEIEDLGPTAAGGRNIVYHILEENGSYSRHDFAMPVLPGGK